MGLLDGKQDRGLLGKQPKDAFVQWITSLPWYGEFIRQYGEAPNLNDPNYDYRAAYKAGITPVKDPYDGLYHWPSVAPNGAPLKSKNHPTAWKEEFMRRSYINPDGIGLTKKEWDRLK